LGACAGELLNDARCAKQDDCVRTYFCGFYQGQQPHTYAGRRYGAFLFVVSFCLLSVCFWLVSLMFFLLVLVPGCFFSEKRTPFAVIMQKPDQQQQQLAAPQQQLPAAGPASRTRQQQKQQQQQQQQDQQEPEEPPQQQDPPPQQTYGVHALSSVALVY
jgi:predicted membrane metal-binding protein